MKPVYMINGFLESGKTGFIAFTLGQPYFQTKGKTLLIVCEEGELEYDPALLSKTRTVMEVIEEEEDFNPTRLTELEKKHKPDRIIIEFNGMWNYKEVKLPWYWKIEQQITMIDGSTFAMYYTNMRSLLAEMIRGSEMIIFNRCDTVRDQLNTYKRNIKAVNSKADVVFEDENGEIDEIFEEDLPYDLNADPIVLDNQGYGIWYLDATDHPERYIGKKLQFVAMVLKPEEFPKNYFVPGRLAMTCCADDVAPIGWITQGLARPSTKSYVKLTASCKKVVSGGEPMLLLTEVRTEPAPAPKEKYLNFNA